MSRLKSFVLHTFYGGSTPFPSSRHDRSTATVIPIIAIPPKVLMHIFSYLINANSNGSPEIVGEFLDKIRLARHRLSSVCRGWRQVILCTSLFWNTINVKTIRNTAKERGFERFLYGLDLSLSRAGTAPLDIIWNTPFINEAQTNSILEVLKNHKSFGRCRFLNVGIISFTYNSREHLSDLSNLDEACFSAGLDNCLCYLVDRSAVHLRKLKFDLGHAPILPSSFHHSLQRISPLIITDERPFLEEGLPSNIKFLSLKTLASTPIKPFSSIVYLKIQDFSLDQPGLRFFPNIEYLNGRLKEPTIPLDRKILMPRLRQLLLEVTHKTCPSLVWITAPALTQLSLYQTTTQSSIDPLMSLNMELLNNRKELSPTTLFVDCYSEFPTLSAFLQRFPRVKRLRISFRSPEVFNMSTNLLLSNILPGLKTLRIELAWNGDNVQYQEGYGLKALERQIKTGGTITCVCADGFRRELKRIARVIPTDRGLDEL